MQLQSVYAAPKRRGGLAHGWAAVSREPALLVAAFVAALAVRLPNFLLIPRYTDEGHEVLWAIDIALGRHLPLTGVDAYDGPFFAYLLAGLFRALGSSVWLPRLTMTVFGALTVIVVYWLGRIIGGRRVGLVAAGLTATSPFLVTYTSHMAFSSCLTPFFTILTMGALYSGVTHHRPALLSLSGLLAALTLQTHPTSAVALLGMAAWVLWRRDLSAWLRRPAPYAALGLFVVGYASMLAANVRPHSLMLEQARQRTYAFEPTLSLRVYLERVAGLIKNVAYMAGGGLPPTSIATRVTGVIIGVLILAGLLVAWRRGERLLLLVFLSTVLLLPIVVLPSVLRYVTFLVPLAYVAAGLGLEWIVQLGRGTRRMGHAAGLVGRILPPAVLVLLTLYALVTIRAYYRYAWAEGLTNAEYYRLIGTLKESGACTSGLLVQDPDEAVVISWQSQNALHTVDYLLTLDRCPHSLLPIGEIARRLAGDGPDAWAVLPDAAGSALPNAALVQPAASMSMVMEGSTVALNAYHRVTHEGAQTSRGARP